MEYSLIQINERNCDPTNCLAIVYPLITQGPDQRHEGRGGEFGDDCCLNIATTRGTEHSPNQDLIER